MCKASKIDNKSRVSEKGRRPPIGFKASRGRRYLELIMG
jgi:hypothetical protein